MAAGTLEICAEILRFSRHMLALAQAGNWEELVAQEAERQQVVSRLKKRLETADHLQAPGEKARFDALIQEILKLDEETSTLTERRMVDIKESLASVGVSRQLNSTYLRP